MPAPQLLSQLSTLDRNGDLTRLENDDCLNTYNAQLVSEYSNVLLVARNRTENVTARWFHHYPTPSTNGQGGSTAASDPTWICGWGDDSNADCDIDYRINHASTWNFTLDPSNQAAPPLIIDHCMAQKTAPKCTVQLIPEVMGIVVVCNVIKVFCFIFAAYAQGFQPLITLGDALASFLQRPDPSTRGLGPLSAGDIRDAEDRIRIDLIRRRPTEEVPLKFGPWVSERRRWFTGASRLRWGLTSVMLGAMWIITLIFCILAFLLGGKASLATQWKVGFGNVSTQLLLTFTSSLGVLGNILVANAPQLILSLIYLSYNGLFTCILISHEFSRYAQQRAPLRVTSPYGLQRGTYFLSLPYRFAIPLLALSGLLHWALSQSIFLAEVKTFKSTGEFDPDFSVSCLGYSSLGVLITLLLATIMAVAPLILGWRQYRPGAPLLESNSLAISAACQLDQACENAVVKYGARGDQVGLSPDKVDPLVTGKRYTTQEELDTQPYVIKSVRETLSLRQKILLGVAAALNLAKFALVYQATAAISVGLYLSYIFTCVLMPLTIIYVFTRLVVAIHQMRRKRIIRRFAWHVVPEVLFMIISFITLGVAQGNNVAPGSSSNGYAGAHILFVQRIFLPYEVSYALVWLFSVVVEVWIWMDQLRYTLASLPNMRSRHIGRPTKGDA